jgi:ubiquinone/menaquinone biosynthesis C-methylase UbiE
MSQFVKDYYNAHVENEQKRLDLPMGRIEFVSTLQLINKYFPKQGHICDIGGGTGRYTIELLHKGYGVTLFDLSEEELRLAGILLDEHKLTAEQLIVGDARDMSMLASNTFEAALLLGPMYHIIEPNERAKVLQELKRILKPQGVAIIAYLNSWGMIKTGTVEGPHLCKDISFLRSMLEEHTFVGESPYSFTESYWSTPKAALQEVQAAELEVISYAGAESFANGMGGLLEKVAHDEPEAYNNIVEVAAEMCELEQYRDSTDHLHIVVRKKVV